ncbi:geranylgeranyl reductase family protein [Spiractinospora alimapuensis]|uniref:geranylgeranyl reductase family protein n=1 Tax=Spiractinospora alimapuensis TaxID=2820884 RepID=UPI001F400BF4|nr:geranylgeranyl reductase family protein [Spiractinospora alimapuensis]QVQ50984.1 geranylgeranyl reductase family protein [Spiractinospora alimapuensis]
MGDTAHPAAARSGEKRGESADVIVVGAGPAGAATAHYLARAGLDVLVCEKSTFPREKVCGDGLTPRGVKQLHKLGVDFSGSEWIRNRGLRVIGGGARLELPWPELADFPNFGLMRVRRGLDETVARHAQAAGARIRQGTNVRAPIVDDRTNRIVGVRAEGREREPMEFRAPLVVAADGNSSRLAVTMGVRKRDDRPLGVALRTYFTSPRHNDDHLESWLELWDTTSSRETLLPGYGWVFGVGDGTSNVGLGILNSTRSFGRVDYRSLLRRWTRSMPEEWGFTEENQQGPIRGSALPMGFNRTPHYARGLLLVGDAGGMINPFNGEGIAYAMEAGAVAAEVVTDAHAAATTQAREQLLRAYPRILRSSYGGYFTLGRHFVTVIGQPEFMRLAARYGLRQRTLMRFALKLLANLTDPHEGDAMDRVINGLSRLAPAA